ncbi:large-conductance mechanosensitive channel protein MscL [Clostridium sp.]|uniref:large-conductance mechanosensitive channel protein MscL n=1 Tax=Clostridium sp. TaxID=1506 RepID=UPI002FC5F231
MLKEFKDFAMKGNVVDLAVGVIIGGAFGKIVTSLVNDIITPLLGLILGRVNVADLYKTIPAFAGGKEIVIKYGIFLQNIIDFVIVAFSIFLFIKFINKFKKKEECKPVVVEEPKPSKEELLLSEIRDLLKAQSNSSTGENQGV